VAGCGNGAENEQKWGYFESVLGAPGRGVLRFLRGGYRNSVHFLPFFRVFHENLQT